MPRITWSQASCLSLSRGQSPHSAGCKPAATGRLAQHLDPCTSIQVDSPNTSIPRHLNPGLPAHRPVGAGLQPARIRAVTPGATFLLSRPKPAFRRLQACGHGSARPTPPSQVGSPNTSLPGTSIPGCPPIGQWGQACSLPESGLSPQGRLSSCRGQGPHSAGCKPAATGRLAQHLHLYPGFLGRRRLNPQSGSDAPRNDRRPGPALRPGRLRCIDPPGDARPILTQRRRRAARPASPAATASSETLAGSGTAATLPRPPADGVAGK
ncbi:MAG: hypothetical protein RLZZ440_1134 [Planctomycetota bacterium]